MTTELARPELNAATIEKVLIGGDLAKLSPGERLAYYHSVCESVGLNPLTQPFQYLTLSGKMVLYARRDATDQLRKIHKVSIHIVSREVVHDVYVVTARATDAEGRTDESTGAVQVKGLSGDALANAYMKAETKSKRRVTLSICGLGMLDETEIETIHDARPVHDEPATTPTASVTPNQRKQIADAVTRTMDEAATLDDLKAAWGLLPKDFAKTRDEYLAAVIEAKDTRKRFLLGEEIDRLCEELHYGTVELALVAAKVNVADIDQMTADEAQRVVEALRGECSGVPV